MFFILKWLKYPSIFKDNNRNVILSKFYGLIKTGEDKLFSIDNYYKILINIIIDNKIKKKIKDKNKIQTRLDNNKYEYVNQNLLQRRVQCWESNTNKVFQFQEEFHRSINEFMHEKIDSDETT